MRFVQLKEENKTVAHNGITYGVSYYKGAVTINGVADENYPDWETSPSTPYALGDYVIVPEVKKIFRAGAEGLATFPLADPDNWVDYGIVNSWKMFASDEFIGSQTVGEDAELEFDFSTCDTIGLIDIEFVSATVQLINNDIEDEEERIVFDATIYGADFGSSDLFEYFFGM